MRIPKSGVLCIAAIVGLVIGLAAGAPLGAAESSGGERVIKVVAQRFTYTPNEIVLKTGQPVVLEFTALDFTHGFSVPDLGLRADLLQGQVTRVRLAPDKAGSYEFLCDNFCGGGHEQMNGKIIVRD